MSRYYDSMLGENVEVGKKGWKCENLGRGLLFLAKHVPEGDATEFMDEQAIPLPFEMSEEEYSLPALFRCTKKEWDEIGRQFRKKIKTERQWTPVAKWVFEERDPKFKEAKLFMLGMLMARSGCLD